MWCLESDFPALCLFCSHSVSISLVGCVTFFFALFMSAPDWLLGILCALLSTALGSLGKVLIRCVHLLNTNESYPAYLRTAWSSFPIVASCIISFEWWGLFPCSCPRSLLSVLSQFLVVVVNPALSVLSYSFAAQSLLAPFAGLSIVWSLLFSTYLLPELPDKSKYRSTVLITLYPFLLSVHSLIARDAC